MQCPSCGREQEGGLECLRCGIVFSKFQPREAPRPSGVSQPARITHHDIARERGQVLLLVGLLGLLGFLLYGIWSSRPVTHPPGILVEMPPEQVSIPHPQPWRRGERVIVPLALFHMKGRVLGTERYRWDAVSDLSPIDVALGWGVMSDQRILDELEIAQGHRRYVMAPAGSQPPLPWPVLLAGSSNMHLIPASPDIEKRLKSLRCGQIVELAGYLVGVQEQGQWVWVSSLSRTDTGDGACEIVWVERLAVQ